MLEHEPVDVVLAALGPFAVVLSHHRRTVCPGCSLLVRRWHLVPRVALPTCGGNGIGIASVHLIKIFRPFQRLHGLERPGSGIGLSTCQRIIERAQGRIWVESHIGKGSTFYFSLSRAS